MSETYKLSPEQIKKGTSNAKQWSSLSPPEERLNNEFLEHKEEAEQIIIGDIYCLPCVEARALDELMIREYLHEYHNGRRTFARAMSSISNSLKSINSIFLMQ